MKRVPPYILGIVTLMFCLFFDAQSVAQQAENKENKKWYKQGQWLNGLKLKPNKPINVPEFASHYKMHQQWWDLAFSYLKETDLENLKPGKYVIDGDNVFATVTEGPTKNLEATKWEAHKNYIDIHYVIRGREKIGITPAAHAKVLEEYDSTKDIAFYATKGKFYKSDPGLFFIVFPGEAHRPGVRTDGYDVIKKIVIKIRKA